MYKVDFHTHSITSFDGNISEKEYEEVLATKKLDCIAVTDHNTIAFAQKLQEKLGEKIIVGEEIRAAAGEIIGLFLTKKIESGLSIGETIEQIHTQGGLVYIPHPFDSFRKGIGEMMLLKYIDDIDIIEGFNGRMILRWQNTIAQNFAKHYQIKIATGSDAHSVKGLGDSYTILSEKLSKKNTLHILVHAQYRYGYQQWYAYIYPFLNKVRKLIRSL